MSYGFRSGHDFGHRHAKGERCIFEYVFQSLLNAINLTYKKGISKGIFSDRKCDKEAMFLIDPYINTLKEKLEQNEDVSDIILKLSAMLMRFLIERGNKEYLKKASGFK